MVDCISVTWIWLLTVWSLCNNFALLARIFSCRVSYQQQTGKLDRAVQHFVYGTHLSRQLVFHALHIVRPHRTENIFFDSEGALKKLWDIRSVRREIKVVVALFAVHVSFDLSFLALTQLPQCWYLFAPRQPRFLSIFPLLVQYSLRFAQLAIFMHPCHRESY